MNPIQKRLLILLSMIVGSIVPSVLSDDHENCGDWAEMGECDANPNYMLAHCSESCNRVKTAVNAPIPNSFYEIIEEDIHGDAIHFEQFRGRVVYAINVASHCGYTAENYETFRILKKYRQYGLEIILFPCNQFGKQEPGDGNAIKNFADNQGFEGIILSKGDVNGSRTRPAFLFLKKASGKQQIHWNFDGKFLIDKDGIVHVPQGDLEEEVRSLLGVDEF